MTTDTERDLSPCEVASLLGISMATVYRRLASGEIPAYRCGRVLRVLRSDVDALRGRYARKNLTTQAHA